MTQLLEQNLLSTKDASALSGYNPDYLARLCRSGKIAGTQIGRTWLVNRESLEQFVREQEERKVQIATELSQAREKEYQEAQREVHLGMSEDEPVANENRTSYAGAARGNSAFVPSPFVSFMRSPAFAFTLSLVIMASSVYAATSGPIAFVATHAGALATAAQQSITGSTNATAPRLRIASNVRTVRTNTAVATVQSTRTPRINGDAIAKRLARIDTPDARAETETY